MTSYVYRQPETEEEIKKCEEATDGCPTNAIGNMGDQYDWDEMPAKEWPEPKPWWKFW